MSNQSAGFREPPTQGKPRRPGTPPIKSRIALALVSGVSVESTARVYAGQPVRWSIIVAVVAAAKRLGMPLPEVVNLTRYGQAKAPT